MTEKKKVIDQNLKNVIKTFTKVINATSYINDKGELVKRRYNSSEPSDINEKSEYPDNLFTTTNYNNRINKLEKIENEELPVTKASEVYLRAKKRKSPSIKKCKCKK